VVKGGVKLFVGNP